MWAMPSAQMKEMAWREGVEGEGKPNSVIDAIGLGFGTALDPEVLRPFVQRYHDEALALWTDRTHAIAESILVEYYPTALADQGLLDATQGWLDAHADAPAGLFRIIAENRDSVARALRAQARDRQAADA